MLVIDAIITLGGPEKGGLSRPVPNGFRPSFSYAGELVACEVTTVDEFEFVPLEQEICVIIKCPYADQLEWDLAPSDPFQLNIASQVIGNGIVINSRKSDQRL